MSTIYDVSMYLFLKCPISYMLCQPVYARAKASVIFKKKRKIDINEDHFESKLLCIAPAKAFLLSVSNSIQSILDVFWMFQRWTRGAGAAIFWTVYLPNNWTSCVPNTGRTHAQTRLLAIPWPANVYDPWNNEKKFLQLWCRARELIIDCPII